MFPWYTGKNNPNWRTHMFQRGWNHQPDYDYQHTLFHEWPRKNTSFHCVPFMPSSTDTSCKLYGFLEKKNTTKPNNLNCPIKYPHRIPITSELTRYVTPIHDGYIYTVYHPYEIPITLVNPSMIIVIPIDGPRSSWHNNGHLIL